MLPRVAVVPSCAGAAVVGLPSWNELVRLVLVAMATTGSRNLPAPAGYRPVDVDHPDVDDPVDPVGERDGTEPSGGHEPPGSSDADTSPEHADVWALVTAAQAGDGEAFGALYDRYVDGVFRFIYYRVHDRTLAEDFTSETFLRALRRISDVRYQGRDIGAWFITIARNIVFDHAKSARFRLEITTDELVDEQDGASGPEALALTALTNEVLLRGVDRLGDEQRECVVLRFLQGLSVAETAEVMGKNEGSIKALQHRAVKRLADLVGDELKHG